MATAIDIDADPKAGRKVPAHAGFKAMNRVSKARALKARVETLEAED